MSNFQVDKVLRMFKRIFLLLFAIMIVLSFSSCASGLSIQEIVDNAINSADSISSYQFEMNMNMDMAVDAEGETFAGNMDIESKGTVDAENQQMDMNMNIGMAFSGQDAYEIVTEMFLIDNAIYMMMNMPAMGFENIWFKSEMPVKYWEEMNQVEPQINLLENAVEVKLIGSEEVNGYDCYVVEIIPDMAKLWDIVMQQANISGQETLPRIGEEFFEQVFKDFSMKQWVEKNTYFLTKVEIEMAMEITPEVLGYPEEDGLMKMNITMDLMVYDYNKPVSIVLPIEANEALEMPIFQ